MLSKKLTDAAAFLAGDETLLREMLHPAQDAVDLPYSLAHASIPVGGASLPHTLGGAEVYWILEGKGYISIDNEKVNLEKDQVVMVPAKASQYVVNEGTSPLVFLCMVSPPWTEDSEKID